MTKGRSVKKGLRRQKGLRVEGRTKPSGQCLTPQAAAALTEETRSLNEGTQSSSACAGRSGIWSCKHGADLGEGTRERSVSVGNRHEAGSHQSGSCRHRDCSREYADRESTSPDAERPHNAAMDTMSRALRQAARSPFSRDIESVPMPSRFARPPFNSYTGKTDPVEHVSHYIQMMSLHSHNDALMCKVFPSSLGPITLSWFNGLKKGSIHSFSELIQEFGVWFMTCSRVPQPVDVLLSMKMGAGETLRNYTSRYWELYNEIGGGNEKIVASTFRMGLPEESELRESLTLKPPEDMRQLMRRIEEYKRLEDDRLQSKGKESIINYPWNNGFNPRHRKDLRIQEPGLAVGGVNVTFKEPIHRIIDRKKNEPYFKRLNRMAGDPSRRNQNLYCSYHRDKGHTTEQCRVLKDHLEQLVKVGHLKEFLVETGDQATEQADRLCRNPLPPPLGVIEVIHAAPRVIKAPTAKGVLTVVSAEGSASEQPPGKKPRYSRQPIAFNDDDLEGTTQPHHDALIVTARIRGFIVKRIMIDQGSGADVMYPDLYRGLDLKKGDLSKEVMVTFIVVAFFSPYTVIFRRPWIHNMGAVSSTLHVKVKFRTDEGITTIRGDQQAARQCLVATEIRQTEQKESAEKAPL
ncbi:uncharacterized protein LOC142616289 [Castanea sativa]|uniref:uncharacterized protein LOC142616289 n=1 Tax=Castanea sativa TaxID=21020 RepID=UPI003F653E6A